MSRGAGGRALLCVHVIAQHVALHVALAQRRDNAACLLSYACCACLPGSGSCADEVRCVQGPYELMSVAQLHERYDEDAKMASAVLGVTLEQALHGLRHFDWCVFSSSWHECGPRELHNRPVEGALETLESVSVVAFYKDPRCACLQCPEP